MKKSKTKAKPKAKKKVTNKLRVVRSWGTDTYYIGRREVAGLREVQIDKQRYDVSWNSIGETIYDMGHTYEAYSRHYYVITMVFGISMELDLNTIVGRKTVIATKFTLREKE